MTGEGLTAAEREALRAHRLAWRGGGDDDFDAHLAAAVERIVTARTAQAEARGRVAALREAADDPTLRLSGHSGISIRGLRARADLAAEVGGDGGGAC